MLLEMIASHSILQHYADQRGFCLTVCILCRTTRSAHREDQSKVSAVAGNDPRTATHILGVSGGSIALTHPLGMSTFCTVQHTVNCSNVEHSGDKTGSHWPRRAQAAWRRYPLYEHVHRQRHGWCSHLCKRGPCLIFRPLTTYMYFNRSHIHTHVRTSRLPLSHRER